MKKYFLYELKKNLLPIVIFTVIACLIYLTSVLNTDFTYESIHVIFDENSNFLREEMAIRHSGSLIAIPAVILCVLCTLVPIIMFSFKMNRRTVDCYYSAPLKREKLYLVKSLVGLIMVFIPYTLCFWLGFLATALKPNMLHLVQFIPIFFISIPLAVLLFGINAFVFTRANSIHDGIIFMGMFTFVAVLLFMYFDFNIGFLEMDGSYWFTYSPLVYTFSKYDYLIDKYINVYSYVQYPHKFEWLLYLFGGITGAAAWAGLFLSIKKEKAENAEQVSSSWFGYKTLIPYYAAVLSSLLGGGYIPLLYYVMIFVAGVVGNMIYRRTFKLKWQDYAILVGAIVLGIILSLIAYSPIGVTINTLLRG